MTPLKSLPLADRPREKLATRGVEFLTTQELVTLILGSGSAQVDVTKLAEKIEKLATHKKSLELADLTAIKGIGLAKAAQILAAFELVERVRPRVPDVVLNSETALINHLHELRMADREHIIALYLDARYRLVHRETLAIGSINHASLLPRDVMSPIKNYPILYVVLAHNHPSQDSTPSLDDINFTKRIGQACKLLGIELLDHLILTRGDHSSLRGLGLI